MKTPHWNRLIRTLNRYEVGDAINEKRLCRKIKAKFNDTSFSLLTKYLIYLQKMGLLEKEEAKKYKILEKVPSYLKLSDVRLWANRHPSHKDNSITSLMNHMDSLTKLQAIKRGK